MKSVRKKMFFLFVLMISVIVEGSEKKRLVDYGFDLYSQNGEDGVIQKIFEIIGTTSKLAVEFGAWDGIHLSNTARLWIHDSWKSVLIESDKSKYESLVSNLEGTDTHCIAINAFVGIEECNSIEALLKSFNITEQVDLMSIDIDGNDYYIFESLQTIRPRVIICEYNPTIPVTMDIYAPYSPQNRLGQSVGALNRIAKEKGYKLIALTTTNAFFVVESEFKKFENFETNIKLLDVNNYMACITDYNGDYANISNTRVAIYGMKKQLRSNMCGKFVRNDILRPLPLLQSSTDLE